MSKKHRLFSEKEKLEKEYLQWCEKANKEIHGGRIDDKSFITVISFLQSIGWGNIKELESENADLKNSLSQSNEECLKWHERAQNLIKENGGSISGYERTISELRARLEKAVELTEPHWELCPYSGMYIVYYKAIVPKSEAYDDRAEAESRLAELKGEKK